MSLKKHRGTLHDSEHLILFRAIELYLFHCLAFVSEKYSSKLLLAALLSLPHLFQCISSLCAGALLEKKVEMDKRGMGVTDYNGMVTKPLGCRPPPISKESSMDRPTFLDKVSSATGTCCPSQCRDTDDLHCLESIERNVIDTALFLFSSFFIQSSGKFSPCVERINDLIFT